MTRIGELGTLAITRNRRALGTNSSVLVAANVVTISLILSHLIMEALGSSETSVLKTVTRRSIPEDGINHTYRRGGLISYKVQIMFLSDV
jgi:hypothetical protein